MPASDNRSLSRCAARAAADGGQPREAATADATRGLARIGHESDNADGVSGGHHRCRLRIEHAPVFHQPAHVPVVVRGQDRVGKHGYADGHGRIAQCVMESYLGKGSNCLAPQNRNCSAASRLAAVPSWKVNASLHAASAWATQVPRWPWSRTGQPCWRNALWWSMGAGGVCAADNVLWEAGMGRDPSGKRVLAGGSTPLAK